MNSTSPTQKSQTPRSTKTKRARSDFKREMKEGADFWLGPIVRSHEIGEYQFIEYRERSYRCGSPSYGKLTGRHCFSAFINGRSTHNSYNNLDTALVGTIAYKHDGCNSRAAGYFMKMIADETPSVVNGNEVR